MTTIADYRTGSPTFTDAVMDWIAGDLLQFPEEEESTVIVGDAVNDQVAIKGMIAIPTRDMLNDDGFTDDLDSAASTGIRQVIRVKARGSSQYFYFGANGADTGSGLLLRRRDTPNMVTGNHPYKLFIGEVAAAEGGGTYFIGS